MITQLAEHCTDIAEVMGSNPEEEEAIARSIRFEIFRERVKKIGPHSVHVWLTIRIKLIVFKKKETRTF